ncbi:hypothetical protein FQN49_003932 [Arthroderma sp. PD_2]|nr:hypothetical protein FQN49_003932 [Arthroderma sp. PD_2]
MRLLALILSLPALTWAADPTFSEGFFSLVENYSGETVMPSRGANGQDGTITFDDSRIVDGHDWYFEPQLNNQGYAIRDGSIGPYIHFPELKAGAVAKLSSQASTFFSVQGGQHNALFTFTPAGSMDGENQLFWAVDQLRDGNRTRILTLQERPEKFNIVVRSRE